MDTPSSSYTFLSGLPLRRPFLVWVTRFTLGGNFGTRGGVPGINRVGLLVVVVVVVVVVVMPPFSCCCWGGGGGGGGGGFRFGRHKPVYSL